MDNYNPDYSPYGQDPAYGQGQAPQYDPYADVQPYESTHKAKRRGERYSIDAMRRLHEGQPAGDGDIYAGTAAPYSEAYYDARSGAYYDESAYAAQYGSAPAYSAQYDRAPAPAPKKKRHGFGRFLAGLLIFVLIVGLAAAAFFWFTQKMPESDDPLSLRKDGCCTVLLAGTDESGMRTDTLMVMYLDRPGKVIRLLSIPRDTMVNRDNPVPKINGAYYANGAEEEGMDFLMDYVGDLIGYRPDGYVLIDLDCFEELVDLMGGVKFDVPMDMSYEDPSQDLYIDLEEGMQKLSGEEAMWLVRFRSGYAMADLERVNVQRDFVNAALEQWTKPGNVIKAPAAVKLLQDNTLTDLSRDNYFWLGFTALLCGKSNLETDTLPGEGAYVNGGSYYVENREKAAALISEDYNPYETEITADDLHPYGY